MDDGYEFFTVNSGHIGGHCFEDEWEYVEENEPTNEESPGRLTNNQREEIMGYISRNQRNTEKVTPLVAPDIDWEMVANGLDTSPQEERQPTANEADHSSGGKIDPLLPPVMVFDGYLER